MEMEMEMSMEEDEYSFDSNTDAIVYGVSDPSGSDESMISGPNISSSSSDGDISHQEQQQIPAAAAPGDGTDDLNVSSCSSSSWITNKQIEQEAAIMIFNVDFGALSRLAVHSSCDNKTMKIEERINSNSCVGDEQIGFQIWEDSSLFSFWEVPPPPAPPSSPTGDLFIASVFDNCEGVWII